MTILTLDFYIDTMVTSSTKYYLSGQDIVDTLIKIRKLIYETISEV